MGTSPALRGARLLGAPLAMSPPAVTGSWAPRGATPAVGTLCVPSTHVCGFPRAMEKSDKRMRLKAAELKDPLGARAGLRGPVAACVTRQ